jgi:hypothetical protein
MQDQQQIFLPFLGMIILTLVVWVYMYSRRIPFILSNRLEPDEITPEEFNRLSPVAVRNPSDNLKNLFEIPVLFYALCLYLYVAGQVDKAYLVAAWMFLLFRVLHSAVHCLTSNVRLRFGIYCLSSIAVWFMALRAAVAVLAA